MQSVKINDTIVAKTPFVLGHVVIAKEKGIVIT